MLFNIFTLKYCINLKIVAHYYSNFTKFPCFNSIPTNNYFNRISTNNFFNSISINNFFSIERRIHYFNIVLNCFNGHCFNKTFKQLCMALDIDFLLFQGCFNDILNLRCTTIISNWHEKRQDPSMLSLFIPSTFLSLLLTHFLSLTIHSSFTTSIFLNLSLEKASHPSIFLLSSPCHKPSPL